MQEIIARDKRGESITDLVQWDNDVNIYLSADRITTNYNVHFFNQTMNEALVVNSTFEDGAIKAKIPNKLLIQPFMIFGYVNVINDTEERNLYSFKINVKKQPKPTTYTDKEDSDYINAEKILAECEQYAANAGGAADEAEQAKNAAQLSAKDSIDSAAKAKQSEQAAKEAQEAAQASKSDAERFSATAESSSLNADKSAQSAKEAADSVDAAIEANNAKVQELVAAVNDGLDELEQTEQTLTTTVNQAVKDLGILTDETYGTKARLGLDKGLLFITDVLS